MNRIDKILTSTQELIYEYDLTHEMLNEYGLSRDLLEKIFALSHLPIEANFDKLVYYTRHQMIPAPKKIGIPSKLGGSRGLYKFKTVMILWYIYKLKERGLSNHGDLRSHIYTYFSKDLPPKPVIDTPFEERLIYNTFRMNTRLPVRMFELEDYQLPINDGKEISYIPCKKVISLWTEKDNRPLVSTLIPIRNLKRKELELIQVMRKDKKLLHDEGVFSYSLKDGKLERTHLIDLTIFKKYPLESKEDENHSYLDFINKEKTYDCL